MLSSQSISLIGEISQSLEPLSQVEMTLNSSFCQDSPGDFGVGSSGLFTQLKSHYIVPRRRDHDPLLAENSEIRSGEKICLRARVLMR